MEIEKIESKINNLPPKIQKQVFDFIDFLSKKYGTHGKKMQAQIWLGR